MCVVVWLSNSWNCVCAMFSFFPIMPDYITDLVTRNSLKVNEIISHVLCCLTIRVKQDIVPWGGGGPDVATKRSLIHDYTSRTKTRRGLKSLTPPPPPPPLAPLPMWLTQHQTWWRRPSLPSRAEVTSLCLCTVTFKPTVLKLSVYQLKPACIISLSGFLNNYIIYKTLWIMHFILFKF